MERPLGLVNLTYISDCLIPADKREPAIAALLQQAREYNRANCVTGALLFSGTRFVQTLEGSAAIVDLLMARIEMDARHRVLLVIDRRDVPVRNFGGWSMAYSGPSLFVSREISRALLHRGTPQHINRLLWLVSAMARPRPPQRRP